MNRRAALTCALWLVIGGWRPVAAEIPAERGPTIQNDAVQNDAALHDRALATLNQALRSQPQWVKVHAAEALLALSYGQDVLSTFERELDAQGEEPQYRIGIWRVLARAAANDQQRQTFLEKIGAAALDPEGPDRVHALEALAKLRYHLSTDDRAQVEQIADGGSGSAAVYARWLLAVQSPAEPTAIDALAALLASNDPAVRGVTAYALRHLPAKLPVTITDRLDRLARQAMAGDPVYLTSAAYLTAPTAEHADELKRQLIEQAQAGGKAERYEMCAALAEKGNAGDEPLLAELLDDPEPDVRVAAAAAMLGIERRRPATLGWLDWAVLVVYALGMLLIGWCYSRVKSVEDYLLGGRAMKPWAVGVSLFATLMSTLTYLAYPGEMIRHGPMILSGILAYPLVWLIVGRLMIPFIMKLRITSAYEILERRFGLSVRMLGSTIFLALRLFWMALIVYATADAVLVPLLHLDASATPWVCMILALITITYTALGGLQAVVLIDVVQTFIMLSGAVLALVLITTNLGGVASWWPRHWSADWDPPRLFFSADARVSVGMAMLSSFTWYICTAGSDQLAIQRYLATRNAAAARQMFGISLLCDAVVAIILCGLGLALFAYFSAHAELLPDGQTISSSADKLLSQYIVRALPAGVAGLMVAGILSAAMDSLSSGLNSATSVIVADWIERFRRTPTQGMAQLRQARLVSWLVGLAVTGLSLLTGCVISCLPLGGRRSMLEASE